MFFKIKIDIELQLLKSRELSGAHNLLVIFKEDKLTPISLMKLAENGPEPALNPGAAR